MVEEEEEEELIKREKEREQGKRKSPLNVIFIPVVLSNSSTDERRGIKRGINIFLLLSSSINNQMKEKREREKNSFFLSISSFQTLYIYFSIQINKISSKGKKIHEFLIILFK
jgi:hypothetical protein